MHIPRRREVSNTNLPQLTFSTGHYAHSERLDVLNTFSRGLYTYAPCKATGAAPRLDLSAWALADIAAASVCYGPTVTQASDQFDPTFEDKVFLRWVIQGRVRVTIAEESHEFGPNTLFLMQARHRLQAIDDGKSLSLWVPVGRVGYDPLSHCPGLELRQDLWHVRFLVSAVQALFDVLPALPSDEAGAVTDQLADLVRAALSTTQPDMQTVATLKAQRAHAMRRYVVENLSRSDLSVGQLQHHFHASRATVYRAFDEVGGVASYVRQHRLAAVHRDLRQARPDRGAIRRIAESHGLWDQTSFLRMFRAEYGQRPSDILGSAWEDAPSVPEATQCGLPRCQNLAAFWAARAKPNSR